MNRMLALIASGVLALFLTACGEQDKGAAKTEESKVTTEETKTVTPVESTQEKMDEAAKKAEENKANADAQVPAEENKAE